MISLGWTAALASALHMFGLALSFGGVVWRGRALLAEDVVSAERADNVWGIAAIVSLGSGFWRALGGLEKGWAFYAAHWAFHLKMGLLAGVLLLELWPMLTLLRYRFGARKGQAPARMRALGAVSLAQAALLAGMVLAAAAMSRALAPPV